MSVHALTGVAGSGKDRRTTTGCGLSAAPEAIETTVWFRDVTCEACLRRACPDCKAGVKHVH